MWFLNASCKNWAKFDEKETAKVSLLRVFSVLFFILCLCEFNLIYKN